MSMATDYGIQGSLQLQMNATDWAYAGEGGKHALFGYRRNESPDKFKGQLLRLTKRDLARSESAAQSPSAGGGAPAAANGKDSLHYIRDIVTPKLGNYVDVPELLLLEWEFVKSLRDQTIAEGCIPHRRRKDWTMPMGKDSSTSTHVTAMLLVDYRSSLSITQDSHDPVRKCLSVEIKPKAGYLTFSPLVDICRRVKYQLSRYTIMQQLYHDGLVVKPWMNGTGVPDRSAYDPLDLFSGKIRQAVENLVSCPQNNFRAWLGNKPLQCSQEWTRLVVDWWSDEGGATNCHATSAESFFIDMASYVLETEPFLMDLLQLQKLDVLDADGAILLYNHLVNLCDGSCDDAEHLVDSVESGECDGVHRLLGHSPLPSPDECTAINALCESIEKFSDLLSNASSSLPPEDELESAKVEALGLLERLSVDESRFLLQNYLFSLAMCDVSFFITFRPCSQAEHTDHATDERLFSVASRQQEGKAGVLVYSGDVLSGIPSGTYQYEIKVVDCDRKPAKKLRLRHQKEEPIGLVLVERHAK